MKEWQRPYEVPPPRTYDQWCLALGLTSKPANHSNDLLTYDQFCGFAGMEIRQTHDGSLYGWWRTYGDKWGEDRTIKEWIEDFNWDVSELKDADRKDLNVFLGHDEFWSWSSGKLSMKPKKKSGAIASLLRFLGYE